MPSGTWVFRSVCPSDRGCQRGASADAAVAVSAQRNRIRVMSFCYAAVGVFDQYSVLLEQWFARTREQRFFSSICDVCERFCEQRQCLAFFYYHQPLLQLAICWHAGSRDLALTGAYP